MFSDLSAAGQSKVAKQITSADYRKTAFELNLYGSDEVIKAYNNLMMHAYQAEKETAEQDPKELMRLWGALLLQIRKNVGNKKTKLDEYDMLRAMIKDIDSVK